jgi:hypothetical protein
MWQNTHIYYEKMAKVKKKKELTEKEKEKTI